MMDNNMNQQQNQYQNQQQYQYQNTYQTSDAQQQGAYQSQGDPNLYSAQGMQQKKYGFGIASLVLGILALCTFCLCINVVFAILSIIFGIIQLVQDGPKGLAVGGIVTSGLSILFMIIFYALVANGTIETEYTITSPYYEFFEDYDDYL